MLDMLFPCCRSEGRSAYCVFRISYPTKTGQPSARRLCRNTEYGIRNTQYAIRRLELSECGHQDPPPLLEAGPAESGSEVDDVAAVEQVRYVERHAAMVVGEEARAGGQGQVQVGARGAVVIEDGA